MLGLRKIIKIFYIRIRMFNSKMSEEHKKTEIAESNNFNCNQNKNLLKKKRRINRTALNNINNEFDLGGIKSKLSKILEEENKYVFILFI